MELNGELGEKICDRCEGSGWNSEENLICPKCLGCKTLDWVEQITGRKRFRWEFPDFQEVRELFPKKMAEELAKVQPIYLKDKEDGTQ